MSRARRGIFEGATVMQWVYVAILLVLLVGAKLAGFFIGRSEGHGMRGAVLSGALAISAFVMTGVFFLGSVNHRWPLAWIAALAACVLVTAGIAALLGRTVGWKLPRVLLALAVIGVGAMGSFVMVYSSWGTGLVRDMHLTRAAQMGEAFGFTPLLPSEQEMVADTLPVTETPGVEGGISFAFSGFEMQERRAADGFTEAKLAEALAPGATPMGEAFGPIPAGAQVTTLAVGAAPAAAVQFERGGGGGGKVPETTTVMVVVIDGIDVRFWSNGVETYENGEWGLRGAYTPAEFAEIAETLEPVE
jgi:hypothetical protein